MKYKHTLNERKKLYNCDGICYSSTEMCGRAEYCPETAKAEARAGIIACLIIIAIGIIFSPILFIAWAIDKIMNNL